MVEKFEKLYTLIQVIPLKAKFSILALFIVMLALPFTISLSQKQQNIVQNAAETGCASKSDYLKQEKTGTTTFRQCQSLGSPPDANNINSYGWKSYDCAAKYNVPSGSMVSVQTNPPQMFRNQFNFLVPNVSCVYTCATAEAVAAGERCVDNPSNLSASQLCSGSYVPSTSGHVCNPGRVCCKVANNNTCQMGVNQNCTAEGAKQCTSNLAGVQVCSKDPTNGCLVWKTTELCQNNTCQGTGSSTSCKPSAECTEGALRCLSTQPQKCVGGKWINPVAACVLPLKCDQLTGTCRCFPGDSCGATPTPTPTPSPTPTARPTASPTPRPTSTPTPTPTPSEVSTKINLVLGLDGIGNTGDTQNANPVANSDPTFRSNPNPINKTRPVEVFALNSSGDVVKQGSGEVRYNSSTGKFEGAVPISNLASGSYSILVKSPRYLKRKLTTLNTTAGGTFSVTGNLIAGDIDSNNQLSILDFNIFISCSGFSKSSGACSSNTIYKTYSDLTDNGSIDQDDYNLFTREWHNFQQGD